MKLIIKADVNEVPDRYDFAEIEDTLSEIGAENMECWATEDDRLYLVFGVYFYGEQGWEEWCKCATHDIAIAVDKANELLRHDREHTLSFNRERYGVCILPINDGDSACIHEQYYYEYKKEPIPYVLHGVDSENLFTVDEVESFMKGE